MALAAEALHCEAGRIAKIDQILLRQAAAQGVQHRQSADAGIEQAYGHMSVETHEGSFRAC